MLVSDEYWLHKIDVVAGFWVHLQHVYCLDNGRFGVVVLFKIELLQHLDGIRLLRRTISDIDVNIAHRWFSGYRLSDPIPHFATVSCNFCHRFQAGRWNRYLNGY